MGLVLIDEQLVFDEDNFLLFRADCADEEPLRVGAIASRCLAMLLRSGGTVVRKRELMEGAWGQFGLEVTDNSLAQVVRQLRLALEKLQPDREFIQTLPRIGYKLADSVRVEEVSSVSKAVPVAGEAIIESERPILAPVMPDTESQGAEPPSIMAMPAAMESACDSLPVSPVTSPVRWGLWVALLLWGALAFLLGRIGLPASPEVIPPTFATPVTISEVQVHLSARDIQPMAPSFLQPLVLRSRKLAELEGLSLDNLHLYLLPARRGADQILCEGELEKVGSRCIGVQQHD